MDPEELYKKDCEYKKYIEDRCQLYLFRMAVYYANNDVWDQEKLKWWYWKDNKYRKGNDKMVYESDNNKYDSFIKTLRSIDNTMDILFAILIILK